MSALTWHRWICPACGNTAATIIDTTVTCICGTVSRVDAGSPLATEDDFEAESQVEPE